MTAFTEAAALSEVQRQELIHLITACADSKLLLGARYHEWTMGAPALEAGIAACSMAQDEFGHVRLLYGLLEHQLGLDRAAVEERPAGVLCSLACVNAPLKDWAHVVAVNALVDRAITLELEALYQGSAEFVSARLAKMLEEERYHTLHGQGWFLRHAEAPKARQALREASQALWPAVLAWFGPDGREDPLVAAGIKRHADAELLERYLDESRPYLKAVGLAPEALTADARAALDWRAWSTQMRRVNPEGPDEATIAKLRGEKNAAFRDA